jgi:LAS superfamily LD-carboxypeptidase LdcB
MTAYLAANAVGQATSHLCSETDSERLGAAMHVDVVEPFEQLRAAAGELGFNLAIDSGFRGFDRQLSIWNRKARGQLAVLDSNAQPLDIGALSERELAFAILRWSALPGASRHHWGTDLDVFDAAARPEGYEVQLVPDEVNPTGMFGPLHEWLDRRIAAGSAFGFFRPYDADRGGVAPERWHLSHGPTAALYRQLLTQDVLEATIREADIALKGVVLERLGEIYERFVINVNTSFG